MGIFRRSPKPAVGQVWACTDPRGWSGGAGGEHFVVLLAEEAPEKWRVAVIETNPPDQLIRVDEPRHNLFGGIRLHPRGEPDVVPNFQLKTLKGNLGRVRATKYDEELGLALLRRDSSPND